jgi:hypothetical protein
MIHVNESQAIFSVGFLSSEELLVNSSLKIQNHLGDMDLLQHESYDILSGERYPPEKEKGTLTKEQASWFSMFSSRQASLLHTEIQSYISYSTHNFLSPWLGIGSEVTLLGFWEYVFRILVTVLEDGKILLTVNRATMFIS